MTPILPILLSLADFGHPFVSALHDGSGWESAKANVRVHRNKEEGIVLVEAYIEVPPEPCVDEADDEPLTPHDATLKGWALLAKRPPWFGILSAYVELERSMIALTPKPETKEGRNEP